MFRSKSVIWVMDAGLITILHLKFRLGSTGLQRLLLELTMTLLLMFGVLPAQYLR